ncbi:MAG: hypothetical protein FJX29_15670, partial [Alphaproteobacteria bacterium]|nr:hypothetical protein [Alphaproteobacteria bacterium]
MAARSSSTVFAALTSVCAFSAIFAAPAQGAEYRLTLAAGQIPRAISSLNLVQNFMVPEIRKRVAALGTGDTIVFREAYAGTLLKPRAILLGVQDGIADIGFEPGVFHPDKLPLDQVTFATPFCTADP